MYGLVNKMLWPEACREPDSVFPVEAIRQYLQRFHRTPANKENQSYLLSKSHSKLIFWDKTKGSTGSRKLFFLHTQSASLLSILPLGQAQECDLKGTLTVFSDGPPWPPSSHLSLDMTALGSRHTCGSWVKIVLAPAELYAIIWEGTKRIYRIIFNL